MPTICRFRGIAIRMYFGEGPHAGTPHFHAYHGGASASYAIADLARLTGRLPLRIERLVGKWARAHQDELLVNWLRGREGLEPKPVEPLK